ncbi:ABC transporter ATP-binding protein [Nakamurella lactea]|uniref:ABC transporter ATP-binding protein n=1 Tax=Nakamurella lactea TaxID=459515 RepID=UPI0003F823FB|nr:ABC transporter ATP-binding protein [Nakamurella lactea]
MSTGEPLLTIDGLSVSLPGPAGPVPVIKQLDLRVDAGEIVGIAGESGSGKSLTALTLLNLLPPGAVVGGSIRFDGQDLLSLDRRGWQGVRGSGISMVFQDSTAALHPMLTIGRQLTEHIRAGLGLGRAAARTRATELLDQMRIPHPDRALRAYPHQFSGGMRQRVAIAIALACRPRLLIADEPTTALDVTVQAGILALLEEQRRESGLAVLFITHDLGVLSALTRRAYIFYAGRVMESGGTADLLTAPAHPYTAALLGARPHGLSAQRTLRAIPGAPVLPDQLLPGCPFEPRCTFAEDSCRSGPPPQVPTTSGRTLACVVAPDLTGEPVVNR